MCNQLGSVIVHKREINNYSQSTMASYTGADPGGGGGGGGGGVMGGR